MASSKIIKQVREQRNFSLNDVADRAGISLNRLIHFEEGTREPSYKQLSALADVYGIASYFLAADVAPNLREALPDFRHQHLRPASPSPKGMQRIWSVENIAEYTQQLMVAVDYAPATLFPLPKNVDLESAQVLRENFDQWYRKHDKNLAFAGLEEQKFAGALRLAFEAQGLLVNFNAAPSADYTGFYVNSENSVPAIFVNREIYSKKAQLFTLVHEYCHFLLGKVGISDPFVSRNDIEKTCNRFAAEFLAPTEGFSRLVESLPKDRLANADRLIKAVSRRSLLSMQASGIRLVETGFLKQTDLSQWLSVMFKNPRVEKDDEPDAKGGAPHAKRIGEVGYLATYVSALAVKEKIIDRQDVRDSLGIAESLQDAAFNLTVRRIEEVLP